MELESICDVQPNERVGFVFKDRYAFILQTPREELFGSGLQDQPGTQRGHLLSV